MPQAMLALLAVMLITLMSFNQQRTVIQSEMAIVRNELTTVAEGVLLEKLTEMSRVDFGDLEGEAGTQEETVATATAGEELVFEIETVVAPVRRAGDGSWEADTDADPDFKEVTVYIRGPVDGSSSSSARLPEENGRGTVHLSRIFADLEGS